MLALQRCMYQKRRVKKRRTQISMLQKNCIETVSNIQYIYVIDI